MTYILTGVGTSNGHVARTFVQVQAPSTVICTGIVTVQWKPIILHQQKSSFLIGFPPTEACHVEASVPFDDISRISSKMIDAAQVRELALTDF